MITGRSAFFSSVTASSNASAGGAMVLRVMRPAGPPGSLPSLAGSTWTSSGKMRWDTPRFRIALLHARLTSSACLLEWRTGWLHWATFPKAACRSTSWNAPGPSTCVSTCPVSASTGERSTFASQSPVRRFVAPGPAMDRQAAGLPVSFPYAEAANDAAPSWRIPTKVISPAASRRRIASASPRLECPTIPHTHRTPQFTRVFAMTSETVSTWSSSSGSPT